MGIRQLLVRVAKPAAMVAVAGALSLSLVVTTPSTAHALPTPVIDVKPTFVQGAQKVLSPGITTAGKFAGGLAGGPWIKAAKMLGMVAFMSSDLWMPIDHGDYGTPPESKEMYATDGYKILPGFRLGGFTFTAPRSMGIAWSFSGEGTKTGQITVSFTCRQIIAQTGKPVGFISQSYSIWQRTGMNASTFASGVFTGDACPNYTEVVSGTMGPQTAGGTTNGPENQYQYGVSEGSFSPTSPDVTYKARSECVDSSGAVTWIEALTSGANDGHVLVPSCAAAGKGHGTGVTELLTQAPGETTWETQWTTGPSPLSDPATPLCDPGKTSSGCTLQVEIDGKPCLVGDPECENWPEVNQNDSTQARVKCKFGPYTLPTASCGLLEPAYVPGGAPVNDPNTDGDPGTTSWADPSGNPIAAPVPAPITPTVPGAVPGGGGSVSPSADQESKECFPTGWGMLNPVEWVYKPVVCASKALFEPKKSIQTRVTSMQAQFANRVPVSWFGVTGSGVSGGGCPTNWAVEVSGHSYSLICGTPADSIIQGFRPVLGAMLIVAMLWPLIRSLFYAAIPVFKVNPS